VVSITDRYARGRLGGSKVKMNAQKPEDVIKSTQDLNIRMMEFLLSQKDKKLSYADVASMIARSFSEFEKDSKKETSHFNKEKLAGKSPELVYSMTMYACFTQLIGDFLFCCSPEEAEKITALLQKKD